MNPGYYYNPCASGYVQQAYTPAYAYPAPTAVPGPGPLELYLANMVEDTIRYIQETRGLPPRGANEQFRKMLDDIADYRDALLDLIVPVPMEVAMAQTPDLQDAALYMFLTAYIERTQEGYAAPDLLVQDVVDELRALGGSIVAGQPLAQTTIVAPIDAQQPAGSAGEPNASAQPQRPGLSVLQPATGAAENTRTMTTVQDISRMITIGSGTDYIWYNRIKSQATTASTESKSCTH